MSRSQQKSKYPSGNSFTGHPVDIDNLVTRVRFTLLVVKGADIHTFGGVNYLGEYIIVRCIFNFFNTKLT